MHFSLFFSGWFFFLSSLFSSFFDCGALCMELFGCSCLVSIHTSIPHPSGPNHAWISPGLLLRQATDDLAVLTAELERAISIAEKSPSRVSAPFSFIDLSLSLTQSLMLFLHMLLYFHFQLTVSSVTISANITPPFPLEY